MKTKLSVGLVTGIAMVIVAAPAGAVARPDLRVTALVDPPSAMRVGDEFSTLARVANSGSAKVGKSTTTRFYLASNPRSQYREIFLASRRTHRLRAGSTTRVSLRARVPQGLKGNTGYFLVACVDATKRVRESDERHNCFASVFPMSVLPAGP